MMGGSSTENDLISLKTFGVLVLELRDIIDLFNDVNARRT